MGQIVTFYSYKGGTGRSMALANVAWALASNRQKVLVIDWDLEAPGLHRYFRAFLSDKELAEPESKGLIEFVRNYATLATTPPPEGERSANWFEPHAQIWKWATPLRWPRGPILNFANRGEIQFVPAGRQGPDYADQINTFEWHKLYEAHGGDSFFQSVREQAKREFDYVLIDSRTGVSDTSGICTIQMPDILVACYTYNFQSIMGASDIARRVLNKRPELAVFPVAMRVEFTETPSLVPMRKLARERFGSLVATKNLGDYFDKSEVPYYPKYSFFEKLAAFEEFPNAKGSINADIRHLASQIAGREIVQAHIEESRRLDVVQEFDPDPAASKIIPDVSPRFLRPLWSQIRWVTLAWGLPITILISLLILAWRRLPVPEGVSVTVDPPTATLSPSDRLQMVATVHGSTDNNVLWNASLGKISSSGLYLAPDTATDLTDTITATSAIDRSQAATALFRITKSSHFLVDPVSVTLHPGEGRLFKFEFTGDSLAPGVNWQVSPKTGDLHQDGSISVAYVAPNELSERQHITLTAMSLRNEPLASAGIELSPQPSPLGRWAYLILVAAAGALGTYIRSIVYLVDFLTSRVLRTDWWVFVLTRPIFGAFAGLIVYFAVSGLFGSGPAPSPFKDAISLAAVALAAGFFADAGFARLGEIFDTLFRPIDSNKTSS